MKMSNVESIWIEAEEWEFGWDPLDDNSDVKVVLSDGSSWVATFCTYRNIATLRSKNVETGECLGGVYFWATDLILIDELTRERIAAVVEDLIANGEFESAFDLVTQA